MLVEVIQKGILPYESVLLEDLFALLGQLDRQYRDLPPPLTSSNLGSCRPSNDLVTKAHANNPNPVLFEQLLCEVDKFQDPGVVVEGVVLCIL